jgi:hypothetical protein
VDADDLSVGGKMERNDLAVISCPKAYNFLVLEAFCSNSKFTMRAGGANLNKFDRLLKIVSAHLFINIIEEDVRPFFSFKGHIIVA